MRLRLTVWAEDLSHAGQLFCVVTLTSSVDGAAPILLGQTETLSGSTKSPDWTKVFWIDNYEIGKDQTLLLSLYDAGNNNKAVGSVLLNVAEILSSPGSILAKELKRGGFIAAHLTQVDNNSGATRGQLQLQVRATNLRNTEGAGMFNKSDPYLQVEHLRLAPAKTGGGSLWDAIYRSRHIKDTLDPAWGECYIDLDGLAADSVTAATTNEDFTKRLQLRLCVYDHDKGGKHEFMGAAKVSLGGLLQAALSGAPLGLIRNDISVGELHLMKATIVGAIEPPSPPADEEQLPAKEAEPIPEPPLPEEIVVQGEEDDIPVIVDDSADDDMAEAEDDDSDSNAEEETKNPPSFASYVAGGCTLRVVVAIDATASNGNPHQADSLHAFGSNNSYEQALFRICTILSKYDSDQKYPVYGFGAKCNGADTVNHCFPMASPIDGDTSTAEVQGVSGIVQAYRETFRSGRLVMSSPRDFSAVLQAAAQDSQQRLDSGVQSYSILLIFTNGSPHDMDANVAALKDAANAPLTVIIVGVGGDDPPAFAGIRAMLAEQAGGGGSREFVRFVPYDVSSAADSSWTEQALQDVPQHMVQYLFRRGIAPQPVATVDEIVVQPYIPPPDAVDDDDDDDVGIATPVDIEIDPTTGEAILIPTEPQPDVEDNNSTPDEPERAPAPAAAAHKPVSKIDLLNDKLGQAVGQGKKFLKSKQGRKYLKKFQKDMEKEAKKMSKKLF